MKKILKNIKFIFLSVIFITYEVFANTSVSGSFNSYIDNISSIHINNNLKIISIPKESIKLQFTILPIILNKEKDSWNILPEYFLNIKNEDYGQLFIGAHKSAADMLLVDAGTFAINKEEMIEENNSLYSLILNPQYRGYKFNISYLSKRFYDVMYLGVSPTHIQALYADSLSAATDFKASIGMKNKKFNLGFNLKYLGLIVGASHGKGFYTSGIGYMIGPLKATITHLQENKINNILFGIQYNLNEKITSFVQVYDLRKFDMGFIVGIKYKF